MKLISADYLRDLNPELFDFESQKLPGYFWFETSGGVLVGVVDSSKKLFVLNSVDGNDDFRFTVSNERLWKIEPDTDLIHVAHVVEILDFMVLVSSTEDLLETDFTEIIKNGVNPTGSLTSDNSTFRSNDRWVVSARLASIISLKESGFISGSELYELRSEPDPKVSYPLGARVVDHLLGIVGQVRRGL